MLNEESDNGEAPDLKLGDRFNQRGMLGERQRIDKVAIPVVYSQPHEPKPEEELLPAELQQIEP
jgi:hypothetical protein